MTTPPATLSPIIAFQPASHPDWDSARTRRLALRAPEAEWCASSLSESIAGGFWAPRCDFSYEGLFCLVNRENWRYLDRVAFQVREGEIPLDVVPGEVRVTPEVVTYTYELGGGGVLEVSYALVEAPPQGVAGGLVITYALRGGRTDLTLVLKPIFDIRHMYQPSDAARHRANPVDAHHLTVVNTNHWLGLRTDRPFEFVPGRELWDQAYPLGRGERYGADEGEVHFKADLHRVFAPGELRLPFDGAVRLTIQAGLGEKALLKSLEALEAAAPDLIAAQSARLDAYAERLPRLAPAVVQRVYVMAEKFGMLIDGARLPESGAWWFRTPWFRNVFEGYLHNWRTLRELGKLERISQAIQLALKYQEPGLGRLPNRLPEVTADHERWEKTGSLPAAYYTSADATTLLYTLVDEVYEHLTDEAVLTALWDGFKLAFGSFKASRLSQRNGTPVLLENGLLLVVPFHSWINGKRVVWAEGMTVTDLPIRCPVNWQIQDTLHFRDSHYAWEQYQYPTYYLPEINAQWLRMLQAGQRLAARFGDEEMRDELKQIDELARAAFKPIFWNPHANNLYNLVTLDRRIDGMPTSTAIEAAALLGEPFFSRQELEQIWLAARNRLLVNRRGAPGEEPRPFGLLVKDSPERVFYDNQQYHEAVLWPRETPYLVRLLRMLGQEATIRDLLETNLAHQMDEAVVFYNNEILSLAEGHNPSPEPATADNPVPVKNPMQWWSQWCDAFLPTDAT